MAVNKNDRFTEGFKAIQDDFDSVGKRTEARAEIEKAYLRKRNDARFDLGEGLILGDLARNNAKTGVLAIDEAIPEMRFQFNKAATAFSQGEAVRGTKRTVDKLEAEGTSPEMLAPAAAEVFAKSAEIQKPVKRYPIGKMSRKMYEDEVNGNPEGRSSGRSR